VDDTGSTGGKTGTLTASTLTGLLMAPAGITYHGLANLNINLGSGSDLFNVLATSPVTNLNTGPGTNTIDVGSMRFQKGLGVVQGYGIVDNIKGALKIHGSGNDTRTWMIRAPPQPRLAPWTDSSLTGLNMGIAGISYSGLSILNVSLGSHANRSRLMSPSTRTYRPATTINGGATNRRLWTGSGARFERHPQFVWF